MKRVHIYILLFISIMFMSSSSIIIRYSAAPALVIAMYRVFFTAGLAAIPAVSISTHAEPNLTSKQYFYMVIAGFFLALHFAFWISSLNYTSISSSVLFTNLQVIFVLAFSIIFLKEKVRFWLAAGILIALTGSALIARGDFLQGHLYGDLLALASGLFVAIYFIIGRKVRTYINVWKYTFFVSIFAAMVLLASVYIFSLNVFNYPFREWVLFLLLALGPGIAGHGILNWALKYLQAPVVAVSILGESVGASLLAVFFFAEQLNFYQMAGGSLILIGIYMATTLEN